MKKFIFIVFLIFSSSFIYSQEYKFGAGVRAGSSNGISLKGFIMAKDDKYIALEAIGASRYGGYSGTLLLEFQKEIHLKGMRYSALYFYGGFGPHFGSYGFDSGYKNRKKEIYAKSVFNIGADVVVGLEYAFADFPITLGIDIRPYYDLVYPGPHYFDAGATIRYAFK